MDGQRNTTSPLSDNFMPTAHRNIGAVTPARRNPTPEMCRGQAVGLNELGAACCISTALFTELKPTACYL